MPTDRLFLFGVPRFERDDEAIQITRRRSLAILTYLAVTRQEHSREHLAGLFYPDYDASGALANLRRELYRLKEALGEERLNIGRERVSLVFDDHFFIDVYEFKQGVLMASKHAAKDVLLCKECLPALERAVDLYRADFLQGFSLPDSSEFDDWQFFEAEGLRGELAEALEALVGWHVAQGEYERGVSYARRWVDLDPLVEASQRWLMKLYAWSGQVAAAGRQYDELLRVLKEELGVEPEQETEATWNAIRTRKLAAPVSSEPVQEAPTPRARLVRLPVDTGGFVGRQVELERLERLFRQEDVRLVTVVGLGGVGKTRLGLAAAQRLVDAFEDGVVFVPLAGVEHVDGLPGALARTLELSPSGRVEPLDEVLNYLSGRRILLLLDNFEQLLEGVGIVQSLLGVGRGVKLLVTSREPLYLDLEWRLDLEGMRFPDEALAGDGSYESIELFIESARQVRPGFDELYAQDSEVRAAVERLCRMVAGMPLAIKLAAAWLRVMDVHSVVEEVARSLDILTSRMRDVPERQRSIRGIFESTWEQLSEGEQRMFAALSAFRGGFFAHAATQVAGANPFNLANLVDRRFLSVDQGEDEHRYRIHELMRQFAAQKLASDPQAETQARRKHSLYYAGLVNDQETALRQGGRPEKMLAEMDNIQAGWAYALQEVFVEALRGYHMGIAIFYWLQGWFVESRETFERATQALLPYDDRPEVKELIVYFQVACGAHSQFMGLVEQGTRHLDMAMQYADSLGDPVLCVTVLDRQARLANERSDFNLALELGGRAQGLYVELGDETNAMRTLVQLGAANYYRQQYEDANRRLEECVRYFRANNLPTETLIALGYLSMVQIKLGEYLLARSNLEQIADMSAQMGTPLHTTPLNSLGRVSVALGELAAARGYFEESVRYCLDHNNQIRWAVAIGLLGDLDRLEGRYKESGYRLNESLVILKESGIDRQVARFTHMLGLLEEGQGDYDRAVSHYSDCLTIYESVGNMEGVAYARLGLSSVARRKGRYESASHELSKSLELGVQIGAAPLILDALDHWGRLYRRFDRPEEAYTLLAFVSAQPQTRYETRHDAQEILLSLMRSHGVTGALRKRAARASLSEILSEYFKIQP